jgi:hypothetical protein
MQKEAVVPYFKTYYPSSVPEKLMGTIKIFRHNLITGWESYPGLHEYEVFMLHH